MAAKVFISYRREDRWVSQIIYNRLVAAFREENIFFDVNKLLVGHDFRSGIDRAVDQSQIVVAIIGPKWLQILHEREIRREEDWVRHEIERALDRGLPVVSILFDEAILPTAADLPDRLKPLRYLTAVEIRKDIHLDSSLTVLVEKLHEIIGDVGDRQIDEARFWDQHQGRRRGWFAVLLALLLWICLFVWREVWPPSAIDQAALGHLLYTNCWVSYDPSEKWLDKGLQPVYPDISSLERDLDLITSAGFSGVLTSSSDGIMADVPRLAKQRNLKVIMGIWDAANRREVSAAIQQSHYVDAYCVGNNGLLDRYSLRDVKQAVFFVKKRTGRPTAISELAIHYDEKLAGIGDWLFPDAHLTLKESPEMLVANVDLDRDIDVFMKSTKHMARLAQGATRPLVFKNVVYPYAGVEGGSRATQAEFFRRLLENLNDPQRGHAVNVSIVAQGAFDAPWKTGKPFLAWDPYTGLIVLDPTTVSGINAGQAMATDLLSPAGQEILRWYPHLIAARTK